jgi:hypothetical protein
MQVNYGYSRAQEQDFQYPEYPIQPPAHQYQQQPAPQQYTQQQQQLSPQQYHQQPNIQHHQPADQYQFDRYTYNDSQPDRGYNDGQAGRGYNESDYGCTNTTYTSDYGAYSYDQQEYAQQTDAHTAAEEYPALESFDYLGLRWNSYNTEEGYQYFLTDVISETSGLSEPHSQWEDPRTHGFITEAMGATAAAGTGTDDSYAADVSAEPAAHNTKTTPKKLSIDTAASPAAKMISPPKSPGMRPPQSPSAGPVARRIFSKLRDDEKSSSEEDEHEDEHADILSPLEVSTAASSRGLSTRVMNPVTASYYSYATTDDDYSDREVVLRKVTKKDKPKKGKTKGKAEEFHPAGAVAKTKDDSHKDVIDEQYKATERDRRAATASTPVRSRGGTISRATGTGAGAVPESPDSSLSPRALRHRHRPNAQEQLMLNLDGSDINESDYTEGESGKEKDRDRDRDDGKEGEKARRPRVSRASTVSASETSDWDTSVEVVKRKPRGLTRSAFVNSSRRPNPKEASPDINQLMEMAASDGRFNIPGRVHTTAAADDLPEDDRNRHGDGDAGWVDGYLSPQFGSPQKEATSVTASPASPNIATSEPEHATVAAVK